MDDEVGGVAPISDEQIEKLELSFGYSDDDYESLVNAFRNAWPSIICRLRSQAAEIAELRNLRDGLMTASNNAAAEIAELRQQLEQWEKLTEVDWEFILAKHNPSDASVRLICEVLGPALGYDLTQATNDLPGSSLWWAVRAKKLETELAEAKRENFKLAAGQCLHELKGDEFGNAYCSRIHELETELSEAKAQRRGAWKSGRDRERQNSIDLRNKLADCERERNALRADLERASEKIEKQNAALLRVYTLEDENNALKADIERVRAWIARSVGEAMNDDGTELWIIEWPKLTENPMADREASMERNDG